MTHRASVPEHLANLADPQFFHEISKGIRHIQESADNLDLAARDLHERQHGQGAEVLRLLAEEEAEKALILLDAVRCPRQRQDRLTQTLRNFRNHVAKRIYAKAMYWNTADFEQIREYVDDNLDPHYMDGPNDVDWILANETVSYRENAMYVDYVREFSQESSPRFWITPKAIGVDSLPYGTPWAVSLVSTMTGIGIATSDGLALVADVWRGFQMIDTTTWFEIESKNHETLNRLVDSGLCQNYEQHGMQMFVKKWIAPMWSLDMKLKEEDLAGLRQHRQQVLAHRKKDAAKRDPALTISREKIHDLSDAFLSWREEMERIDKSQWESQTGSLTAISGSFYRDCAFKLESYDRLLLMFTKLTKRERVDLTALSWFARKTGDSWTYLHEHAEQTLSNDYNYEIGLGAKWLPGLTIWENPPE